MTPPSALISRTLPATRSSTKRMSVYQDRHLDSNFGGQSFRRQEQPANEGDVVTLSFTGSEKLRNPLVELTGERQELSEPNKPGQRPTQSKRKMMQEGPYGMEELVLMDVSNMMVD